MTKNLFLFLISLIVPLQVFSLDPAYVALSAASSNSTVVSAFTPLEERFEGIKPHLLKHVFQNTSIEVAKISPINSISCFLNYAWEVKEHQDLARQIAKNLKAARVKQYVDRWENRSGKITHRFAGKIEKSNRVIFLGSQELMEDYDSLGEGTINTEIEQIFKKLIQEEGKVIPILLDGNISTSFPSFIREVFNIDFRDTTLYFENACELLRRVCSQKEEQILLFINKFIRVKTSLYPHLPTDLMNVQQ